MKDRFLKVFSLLSALCVLGGLAFGQSAIPSTVSFPAGTVGAAEAGTLATVFTNTSPVTITSLTVTVTGGSSGDYSVTTSPSTNCGGSLTAGSACTITVTFTPGGFGARNSTLAIAWTGTASTPFTVFLAGTGIASSAGAAAQTLVVATAYTNATTSFTSVPGLAFAIAAGQSLTATCDLVWQGSATTTGPDYQFTGPATGSPVVAAGMQSAVTATTQQNHAAVAFSSAMANTGTITATTNFVDRVVIGVINGTVAGTVQLQAAANGSGTLTIQPGSYCLVK